MIISTKVLKPRALFSTWNSPLPLRKRKNHVVQSTVDGAREMASYKKRTCDKSSQNILTRIIQSLYYALLYPAIVPIEGAVLFELSICMKLVDEVYFRQGFVQIFRYSTGVGSSINNKVQGHLEDRWATIKKKHQECNAFLGGWPKSIPTGRSARNV